MVHATNDAIVQVDQSYREYALAQPGGNMEGKEMRFGIGSSTLFATITTDASCGAINSWHDSYTPLGGLVPLVNIQLGEIIFGGVGSGLYGLLVFAILSVFIAGLMVGRTPEYLGKKIEQGEMKMASLAILILPLSILGFTALATVLPAGYTRITNAGPHGLSEMLYAFSSMTGNNGSAFAGLLSNNAVLQLDRSVRDAHRPFRLCRAGHGTGRVAGGQKGRTGGTGNLPDHRTALRVAGRWRHPDRRRADVLPGAGLGPYRRASADACRQDVLNMGANIHHEYNGYSGFGSNSRGPATPAQGARRTARDHRSHATPIHLALRAQNPGPRHD